MSVRSGGVDAALAALTLRQLGRARPGDCSRRIVTTRGGYAAATNHKSILASLDEHYFNHPVNVFLKKNAMPEDFDDLPPELQYDDADDEDFEHTSAGTEEVDDEDLEEID